jgi:type I restriction enzyme M protein
MAQEVKLTTSVRGTGRASADIVIWKNETEKQKKKTAFLVVELKADYLKLKVEDCYQGYNYATWSRAKLFAISNGHELQVYKTVEEELPLKLQPVNDIPQAQDIQDDKKLEEALKKTKEFTGNEFAKLLHKCHNIIRNNDKLSPEASFDEISKILFIKITYERNPKQESIFSLKQFDRLKEAWNLSRGKSEKEASYMQKLFEDVKEEFENDNIFDENEKIKLREKSFEQIVKELEIYNLTSTSADVKGIAFESIRQEIDTESIEIKKAKQKELFGDDLENIDDEELQKQYEEFLELTNQEQEKKIVNLSRKSIYGTDANPRMARVSKMNMIMHGNGHNGIHHNDGLLKEKKIKYFDEINPIEEQLKLRGKEASSADDKKLLRVKLKELQSKRDDEIKQKVKEQFDYEIPISDIKKAGITTTGAVGDNQLPELLQLFTEYRKENQLWN